MASAAACPGLSPGRRSEPAAFAARYGHAMCSAWVWLLHARKGGMCRQAEHSPPRHGSTPGLPLLWQSVSPGGAVHRTRDRRKLSVQMWPEHASGSLGHGSPAFYIDTALSFLVRCVPPVSVAAHTLEPSSCHAPMPK